MKQIKYTDEYIESILESLKNQLKNNRSAKNSTSFTMPTVVLPALTEKIKLYYSTQAFLTQLKIVAKSPKEVAWHGIVERTEYGFVIQELLLYPQIVTGVTVDTNQIKYNEWIHALRPEQLNHMRFQGHSHVTMPVSPSYTDEKYYDDILSALPPRDYYIFLITNKQGDNYIKIYDLANNVSYDPTDIEIVVLDDLGENLDTKIVTDLAKYITEPVRTYNTTSIRDASDIDDTGPFSMSKWLKQEAKNNKEKANQTKKNSTAKKRLLQEPEYELTAEEAELEAYYLKLSKGVK